MVEFGKRLRRIKLRHSSVDVYRYMCLTSCSAVFVGLKERQDYGAYYAALACIGDCKAREGLVILCCYLALSLGL